MNNREKSRIEKYVKQWPVLGAEPWLAQLTALCVDPNIGFPPLKQNQRMYRQARKNRDALVEKLYEEAIKNG